MDIHYLHKQGLSIRQIAQQTGHSRNTVRKVLRGDHSGEFQTPRRSSSLEPFHSHLTQRYSEYRLSAVRLHAEIRDMGFEGSASTVRRFLRQLRNQAQRQEKTTVRFETPPGKQAQADWAECGTVPGPDGKPLTIYAFVMVLSHCRKAFVRFTTSMKLPVLIEMHRQAFAYFGGWPQSILYDNMKQVRVGPGKLNEQFQDFAKHYGIAIKTHRAYRPRTKGKVERLVDYVKDNFLAGRSFVGLDDLNLQAERWLDQVANRRVHATTGRVPEEVFLEIEQQLLTPLSAIAPYHFHQPVSRKVSNESMIHFGGSRYSVPPQWVGREVEVSADAGKIVIQAENCVIAEHSAAMHRGQSIVSREHLAELWKVVDQQIQPPPREQRRFDMTWNEQVAQTPLALFEEFAGSKEVSVGQQLASV